MIVDKLFAANLPGLQKVMDLSWRRNKAISSNIANAETPLYEAVDLHYGSELKRSFAVDVEEVMRTDESHLSLSENGSSHFIPDYSGMMKPDGNNVDIDIQMGRLAENSGKYSQAANLIRKQFETIRQIIRSA
jgi:flagellar basal-body rod protein FlgB